MKGGEQFLTLKQGVQSLHLSPSPRTECHLAQERERMAEHHHIRLLCEGSPWKCLFSVCFTLTTHGNQSGIFPSIEQQWGSKSFTSNWWCFYYRKRFLDMSLPQDRGKYTRLSPWTSIWLPLSPVQSPLTCQQPLNPIQYSLLQIVVLMA